MVARLGAAGDRMGDAVASAGDMGLNLAMRVKHATDSAYVVGSVASLNKANQDFHTWTETNPDTSTWQSEFDRRMSDAKSDVLKGSANLGQQAKIELNSHIDVWQKETQAGYGHLSTAQNLKNAAGTFTDAINFAAQNLDTHGAHSAIDTAVASGVFSPAAGASKKKQVGATIAFNVASNEIADYAKGFAETINDKDENGNYVNHPELAPKAREILFKSAVKTAADNRTLQLEKWRQQAADVQSGAAEPPDMDDVKTIADHLGIDPKVAEKVFVPPTQFNADGFTKVSGAIASADVNDLANPNSPTKAHLLEQVYAAHLPAHAQEELFKMIEKKADPKSAVNSPVAKEAFEINAQNFKLGLYGKYETHVKNPKTGEVTTVVNKAVLEQAQQTQAKITDAVMAYMDKNPNATHEDVAKFVATVGKKPATKAGAALFKFNP
jgi:signal recognition particle subunit SEC65